MQTGIHPTYYPKAKFTCACGASFTVGSTVESFTSELCSACHPFYTGQQKIVDTARRVEKFLKRSEKKATKVIKKREKKAKVKAKKTPKATKELQ